MEDGGGPVVRHVQTALEDRAGHVTGKDTLHAVVAEPFAGLVADDEFDLWGPAVVAGRARSTHAFFGCGACSVADSCHGIEDFFPECGCPGGRTGRGSKDHENSYTVVHS